jgi:predicted secreted hydrolase
VKRAASGGAHPLARSSRGSGLLAGVLTAVAVLGAGLGLVILSDEGRSAPPTLRATLAVAEALSGGPADGFARALAPRALAFPADHGPHPAFRTEWWYWTGNLRAPAVTGGVRRFGFQLTFFRTALATSVAPRRSAWGARDVYMAHLALTDVAAGRFHARDRWARAALDLAGATGDPVRVWLGDWTAEGSGPEGVPMRLRAGDDDVRIDLTLAAVKPPVLHGERGLSRKSDEPGNASYYYSLTRMRAAGEVRLGGQAFPVEGQAWMDREWSTSALGPDLVGWDWFALQLDDGRELMFYRLRRKDGGIAPTSQGTIVEADGAARSLERDAVEVLPLGHWTSPRGGTRYPSGWRLRIPALALELTVTPELADQELDLGVRYWEGAVRAEGTAEGRPLGGEGYVELVGYATRPEAGGEAVRQ